MIDDVATSWYMPTSILPRSPFISGSSEIDGQPTDRTTVINYSLISLTDRSFQAESKYRRLNRIWQGKTLDDDASLQPASAATSAANSSAP